MANHVIGPALAAADQVLALGDLAMVQLAGEHRDALSSGVVAEPMAGHADLAAAAGPQHGLIEIRPGFAITACSHCAGPVSSRNHQTTLGVHIREVGRIAAAAAELIMQVRGRAALGRSIAQQSKPDHSPVTEADLAAHQLIAAELRRLTPGVPVLSEEAAEVDFETRSSWSRFWLVDPLDGTKEFLAGRDDFTVNIALIEGHHPILGLVQVPPTGVILAQYPMCLMFDHNLPFHILVTQNK